MTPAILSRLDSTSFRDLRRRLRYWRFWEQPMELEQYCGYICGLTPAEAHQAVPAYADEFLADWEFFLETNRSSFQVLGRPVTPAGWSIAHYVITRILRPSLILETGVFHGHSSACWLLALHRNEYGRLISIDLPAAEPIVDSIHLGLPAGRQPGWIIPDRLRSRHTLLLGDAREILPRVLAEGERADVFFHDSLHTLDHMLFEFRSVRAAMGPGGIVLSDDYLAYDAFARWACEIGQRFASFRGLAGIRLGAAIPS